MPPTPPPPPSTLTRLIHRYRALRLPWRRRILIGTDLHHNTYWEHRLSVRARPRRSVEFAIPGRDWVDYAGAVPVQWHQWLRATRDVPPSITELVADGVRLERMKGLAAASDERWKGLVEGEGKVRVIGEGGPTGFGRGVGKGAEKEAEKGKGAVEEGKADPWKAAEEQRKREELGQADGWSPAATVRQQR